MTPTPKLRFVERTVPMHPFYKDVAADGSLIQAIHTYRVLQQWYEWDVTYPTQSGEWRDVPLEVEHDGA